MEKQGVLMQSTFMPAMPLYKKGSGVKTIFKTFTRIVTRNENIFISDKLHYKKITFN